MWNPNITFRPSSTTGQNVPWFHRGFQKRKMTLETSELPPTKMYISEEKMVSQLNSIHLSNSFTSHGSVNVNSSNFKELPKLTMCDELKSLPRGGGEEEEKVLPRQLLEKFRRPTNALVLWQPPPSELGKIICPTDNNDIDDENIEIKRVPLSVLVEEDEEGHQIRDVDMVEDNNNNGAIGSHLNAGGVFGRTI